MNRFDFYNKIREELYINLSTIKQLNSDLIESTKSEMIDYFIEKIIISGEISYKLLNVKVDVLRHFDYTVDPLIRIELCFMSDDNLKLDKKSKIIKYKALADFNGDKPYFYSSNRKVPIWKIYEFNYKISTLKDFEFLDIKNANFI